VENLVSQSEVSLLKNEIASIARGRYGTIKGLDPIPSDSKPTDDEVMQKYLCIHHAHKISKELRQFLSYGPIVDVLTTLISPNVKCMQSMFFVKGSKKPGQAWHQDEYYIPTRDRSLVGAWVAVDDATIHNGCLWMHPGSHQHGILWPQRNHNDPRFDPSGEAIPDLYEREGGVPLECRSGSVCFFNGYVLHRSLMNQSNSFRRAFCSHYMSAESLLPWDCDGSIPKTDDNRDIIMVAGQDPYAYKGVVDNLTAPFLRIDRALEHHAKIQASLRGFGAYQN